jgi:hypothetical protein
MRRKEPMVERSPQRQGAKATRGPAGQSAHGAAAEAEAIVAAGSAAAAREQRQQAAGSGQPGGREEETRSEGERPIPPWQRFLRRVRRLSSWRRRRRRMAA